VSLIFTVYKLFFLVVFVNFIVSHCDTMKYNWSYSARLVKWVTENNRPLNIINDRELCNLLTAGRPSIHLPLHHTILRDLNAAFEKCRDRVAKLLQVSLLNHCLLIS
jgi:hypothetical protein